ncbi:hypothetical protein FGO68_gene13229 [Halteria grandinella]|uniref:Uncharacterized protein n=1 Tax=Halteria grandinella TaxID=5974 RepID=A0A8J8T7X6_HALGN|nr:hypothetical protein FGO68_gene13229 [Halteria grandinella]
MRQPLAASPSREVKFVPFKLDSRYYKLRLATESECIRVEYSRANLHRAVMDEGTPRKLVIHKVKEVNLPNQGSQISPKSKQAQLSIGGGQGEGFMEDFVVMEKQFSFLNIQIQRLTPRIKPLPHSVIKDSLVKLQWTDEDQEREARKACDFLHKLCARFKRDLKVPQVYEQEQTYLNRYTSLQGGIVDLMADSQKTPTNFIAHEEEGDDVDDLFGNNDSGSQELAVEDEDEENSYKYNAFAHALKSENQSKSDLNKCVRQSGTPEEGGRRPSFTDGDLVDQRENFGKYSSGQGNQRKCTYDEVVVQKNQLKPINYKSSIQQKSNDLENKSERSLIQLRFCEPINEIKGEIRIDLPKNQGQNQHSQDWGESESNMSAGDEFPPRIRFVSGQSERRFELGLIQCESIEQAKHYIGMQRKISSIIDGEQKQSNKKLLNLTSKGLKDLMEAQTSTNKQYQQYYLGQNNTATRISQKEDESFRSVLSQYSSGANLNNSGLSSSKTRKLTNPAPSTDQHNQEHVLYVLAKDLPVKKTESSQTAVNNLVSCGQQIKAQSVYSKGVAESPENVLVIPDGIETQDNSPDSNASSGYADNRARQGPVGINSLNYPINKISNQPRKDSQGSSFDFNIFNLQQQLLINGLQPGSNNMAAPSVAQNRSNECLKLENQTSLGRVSGPDRKTKINKFKIKVSSLLEEVPQDKKDDLFLSYVNEEAREHLPVKILPCQIWN